MLVTVVVVDDDGDDDQIKNFAFMNAYSMSIMLTTPFVMVMLALVTYFNKSGEFKPDIVFTAVSLLLVIRFPLMMLPMAIAGWVQGRASIFFLLHSAFFVFRLYLFCFVSFRQGKAGFCMLLLLLLCRVCVSRGTRASFFVFVFVFVFFMLFLSSGKATCISCLPGRR